MGDARESLAWTLDPDRRRVELAAERWGHILAGHPELARHLASVTEAVREPDRRTAGQDENEEWFYLQDAGPSRWRKVVVHHEGGRGRIVTPFGRRSMP